MNINLDIQALTALYPYIVTLDNDLKISWASPLMIKALTYDPKGRKASEIFKLSDSCGSIKDFAAHCNQIINITILTDNCSLPLKAVCLCLDNGEIKGIAGTHDIASIERIEAFNLTIDDLPLNDPLIDILLLRSELETSKKDLREAVNKLRQKQSELKTAETYRLQLSEKLKELKEHRAAVLNMLEDMETSRIELRDINAGLEERIQDEIGRRLEKEQLLIHQSRLAAMGEMIGAIAHQWRQPLNAVALVVQDLRDAYDFGELDQKYIHDSAQEAMKQIKFMSKTIDDFRNFYKPDKEKSDFSIKKAIVRVISLLDAVFKKNKIIAEIEIIDDVQIAGYENEYSQVILNILNNAKDALVQSNVEKTYILIKVFKENGRATVTIADNAGGIPENIIDRIFDPYFTTKEQGKGTGIGLYMSKIIIEQNMGGQLTVRNINGGAEFKIQT